MSHECGIIVIKYFLIKYANKIKKNGINNKLTILIYY